jgi:hypothetical protein
MNPSEDSPIAGLRELPRQLTPARDLWSGIAPRLRRRRNPQPWIGFALAASVMLALAVQLRLQPEAVTESMPTQAAAAPLALAAAMPAYQRALVKANLKIADDAENQLRRALRRQPGSESLQRLLQSTHRQQRELRQLLDAGNPQPASV